MTTRWLGAFRIVSWLLLGSCQVQAEPSVVRANPGASATGVHSAQPAQPEASLGVADRGIFPDLDGRVRLALPAALDKTRLHALYDAEHASLVLYEGNWPVKVYPVDASAARALELGELRLGLRAGDHAELSALLTAANVHKLPSGAEPPPGDADGDGIPDPLDSLLGAHKAALNADHYDGRYQHLAYPMGDVPRTIGVCTDVVIRSLRNAGIDLQRAVHEDIARAPRAYPSVTRPNADIDHRRVKSLLPYFVRHFEARAAARTAGDPYRPGDIVFFDTFPDRPGTEHVGIVSDELNADGAPLIINNWTDGTVTRPMDLLSFVPVTHRFRMPPRVAGARAAGPISDRVTQLVVVLSDSFEAWRARLQRYERAEGQPFRPVGPVLPAVLGAAGYGWGDGIHGSGAPAGHSGPRKREGDRRSPAGVFALGIVHGYGEKPGWLALPYRRADAAERCVDDPQSRHYNQVVSLAHTSETWRSAEHMRRDDNVYELALDIAHNQNPVTPGHGSCIFAHVWAGPDLPVTGCTALSKADLRSLLAWLKPDTALWVGLPEPEYRSLRDVWELPAPEVSAAAR